MMCFLYQVNIVYTIFDCWLTVNMSYEVEVLILEISIKDSVWNINKLTV